jgi:nitrogen fixation/metabolism regulation signal transduction histidine kinase
MQANIKGLVERLKLANGKGMMPLYEAISNAMDAIIEAKKSGLTGGIDIRLIPLRDLATEDQDDGFIVDGFEIQDNGVGLDSKNLEAFRESPI